MTDPADLRSMIELEKDERHRELRDLEDKLRNRIHEARSATSKVEGMVTEVRVASNERHTRLEEQQRQTKDEVTSINVKLDSLRDVVDTKLEGMRNNFNTEFRDVKRELVDMRVAVGKTDVKSMGIIGGIVIVANMLAQYLPIG